MLFKNGKKAGLSEVYDDPDALIDAASNGKFSFRIFFNFMILYFYLTLEITGNFNRIQDLVQSVDVDQQNGVGDTALIRACEGNECLFEHFSFIQKYN